MFGRRRMPVAEYTGVNQDVIFLEKVANGFIVTVNSMSLTSDENSTHVFPDLEHALEFITDYHNAQ